MKTLVTGGTGFTGSHLVRRLLKDGHDVSIIDADRGLFFDDLERLGAKLEIGTIEDRSFCERAVEGTEVVFHLAAAFRRLDVPKSHYWDVNVEGTRYLAEASHRYGVYKFIYCSTQGVHGHIDEPPGDESSPIAPEDYYQYTKYEGERVVNEIAERTGLDAVTLRPTAIYGPGDPARFLMLFRMCSKGVFRMFGDGETTYHPVYIDNLVDAFVAAMNTDGLAGKAYIIADAEYYTLNDLVMHVGGSIGIDVRIRHYPFWPLYAAAMACEAVCYPLRITPPLFRRRVDWFRQVRAFRIERARADMGYEPRVGIEEGLRRTARWYCDHGYLPASASAADGAALVQDGHSHA